MSKKILSTVVLLVLLASIVSVQWIKQVAPGGTINLYSVYAIKPYSVAASGYQGLLRTINGGATWTNPLPIGGVTYYTVHTGVSFRWYSLSLNTGWYMQLGNPSGAGFLCCHPDNIFAL